MSIKPPNAEQQQCPYCHAPASIIQLAQFLLPEREVFKMRSARLNHCKQCQQVFMSLFEETVPSMMSGTVQDKVWNLYQYYLPPAMQHDLLIKATLCGSPNKKYCRCGVHAMINEIDFSRLEKLEDE